MTPSMSSEYRTELRTLDAVERKLNRDLARFERATNRQILTLQAATEKQISALHRAFKRGCDATCRELDRIDIRRAILKGRLS
jgi:hypothetical protein